MVKMKGKFLIIRNCTLKIILLILIIPFMLLSLFISQPLVWLFTNYSWKESGIISLNIPVVFFTPTSENDMGEIW